MAREEDVPSHCECPHCLALHKMPMCVYAHWTMEYTVTCSDEDGVTGCGKKFWLLEGDTGKL